MAAPRDIQRILHSCVKHTGNPRHSAESFEQFAIRFARRFAEEQEGLALLLGGQRRALIDAGLARLEESGLVQLERNADGAVSSIHYTGYYLTEVARYYTRMAENSELPFPSEEHLAVTVPGDLARSIAVSEQFMELLTEESGEDQLLALRFPDEVRPVLATLHVIRERMPRLVLYKVRSYLRTDRNASYLETKLRSIFRTREILVHDTIETALTRPDDALRSIIEPNDFHFHFWTQLSTMIIKEYAKKNEKLEIEHAYVQAAYMLGYFSVHYKGRNQRRAQLEETRKLLGEGLQKPPYAFTPQDVYALTDDKGVAITKKAKQEEINAWLEEMRTPAEGSRVGDLVTVNTPEKSGLLVHTRQYLPLLFRQIRTASTVLRRTMTNEMAQSMLQERNDRWVVDDDAYEQELAKRVRAEYPLLAGLATFQTLFLVADGVDHPTAVRERALGLVDTTNDRLRPWSDILEIPRSICYQDARLQLPAWMLIPIVRGIVRLMRRMFRTGARHRRPRPRTGRSSPAPSAAEQRSSSGSGDREARKERFRAVVEELQREYLAEHQSAEARLQELARQWNPLIEPVARENLVEDVNSLCRDTIRRMRLVRTLEPPTPERIEELARRIAGNSTFDRIKRRATFETYLRLYMLTVLRRV